MRCPSPTVAAVEEAATWIHAKGGIVLYIEGSVAARGGAEEGATILGGR